MNENKKSVLIVWVYYPAAGHFAEAIEAAANYSYANPELEISLAVNSNTFWKLAHYCSWIKNIIPVDVDDVNKNLDKALTLKNVIKDFSYVIFPERLYYTPQDFSDELLRCNRFLQSFFTSEIWRGYNNVPANSPVCLKAKLFSPFKMDMPEAAKSFAYKYKTDRLTISLILRGSPSVPIWPTLKTWKYIFKKINSNYPSVQFILTGVTPNDQSNTIYQKLSNFRFKKFIDSVPNLINCYDVGVEKQLALIQQSDLFISPHTGFAFFAPCLGTPWLALSGTNWEDQFMGGTPFYASLPKCNKYPCSGEMKTICKLKINMKIVPYCMNGSLKARVEDILMGISLLLDKNYTQNQSFLFFEENSGKLGVNKNKLHRLKKYKLDINEIS